MRSGPVPIANRRPTFRNHVFRVLLSGPEKQMVRTNTTTIVSRWAVVTDEQAVRDGAVMDDPRRLAGCHHLSIQGELPVPTATTRLGEQGSGPDPAVFRSIALIDFAEEPLSDDVRAFAECISAAVGTETTATLTDIRRLDRTQASTFFTGKGYSGTLSGHRTQPPVTDLGRYSGAGSLRVRILPHHMERIA